MDVNEIKRNADAERKGNYDHIIGVSMLSIPNIGGGCEGKNRWWMRRKKIKD